MMTIHIFGYGLTYYIVCIVDEFINSTENAQF